MTTSFTFLNDATGKPAVYSDRTDLAAFTLTVTTDSATPIELPMVRIGFPTRIFAIAQISHIVVASPGWQTPVAAGPFLTLTPSALLKLSRDAPLVIKLIGIIPDASAATSDVVQLFVGSEAPTTPIFLMKYPAGAGDLTKSLSVAFLPATVYRTPSGSDAVDNVLVLRLTNLQPDAPLVTKPWSGTPTVSLSFVYGNDIGALTPADPPISDPHSAFNITVDVMASYRSGTRSFDWHAIQPNPATAIAENEATAVPLPPPAPVWTLQPVPENDEVLGAADGATAEFRLSGLTTAAPAGQTLAYLQFTDFPGYDDCYFAVALAKVEPVPAIVFFDGVPNYVATPGDTVTLAWQTIQMAKVALQADGRFLPGPFDVGHGRHSQTIEKTTEFALMAFTSVNNEVPARTAQYTAHVPDATVLSFAPASTHVAAGKPVTLKWRTAAALSGIIAAKGYSFAIPKADLAEGAKTVFPHVPTQYTLTLTGQNAAAPTPAMVYAFPAGWSSSRIDPNPQLGEGPVLLANTAGLTLVGGNMGNPIYQCVDAMSWNQTAIAAFPPRYDTAGATLNDTLFITGGRSDQGALGDVWQSTDGTDWTCVSEAASWPARSGHGCIAFTGKLWVIGGINQNLQPLADVWSSSDGVTWQAVSTQPGWSARSGIALAVFEDKLWLFGGRDASGTLQADLWTSPDGVNWTEVVPGGMPGNWVEPRERAVLATPDGQSLYLFGGTKADGSAIADLTLYDSGGWDLATGPGGWSVTGAGAAFWQGALWLAGGKSHGVASDQVWSWYPGSDG